MTPREAADRLLRAEFEYRRAQLEHDGTTKATVRYQAAKRELDIAFAIARAVLLEAEPETVSHQGARRTTAARCARKG